jgi:hypothetical protein
LIKPWQTLLDCFDKKAGLGKKYPPARKLKTYFNSGLVSNSAWIFLFHIPFRAMSKKNRLQHLSQLWFKIGKEKPGLQRLF